MTPRREHLSHLRAPILHQPRATTAELYQASTALAIPLLRSLAQPPLVDRIDALHTCADIEPFPPLSVQLLVQCEISFQTTVFALIDNEALTYLSALLYELLDRSTPGIALPSACNGPDPFPYPRLREIVDLVSKGEGDQAVRLAHHRADRIYALMFGENPRPILTALSSGIAGHVMR